MSEFGHIVQNLQNILNTIAHESALLSRKAPRLVAVSKTHPPEAILEAYNAGQRHFGENYVQELCTKADSLKESCPDIKWHFIGNLQSNKAKLIANVPNIFVVESVYSASQVTQLQKAVTELSNDKKLNILIQVNTSLEESKGGVPPSDVEKFVKEVKEKAPNLSIQGLMTIGSINESLKDGENSDFQRLVDARKIVANVLEKNEDELDLSMGMSSDYITAIKFGSTSVRIGTAIFGQRNYTDKR